MDFTTAVEQVMAVLELVSPEIFEQSDRQDIIDSFELFADFGEQLVAQFNAMSGQVGPMIATAAVSDTEVAEVVSCFESFGLSPEKFAILLALKGDPATQIAKLMKVTLQKNASTTLQVETAKTALLAKMFEDFNINS